MEIDVQLLENKFLNSYKEGDSILYMYFHMTKMKILWIFGMHTLQYNTGNLLINHLRKSSIMTKIMKGFVVDSFFLVDNHRVTVWCRHIDKLHGEDRV